MNIEAAEINVEVNCITTSSFNDIIDLMDTPNTHLSTICVNIRTIRKNWDILLCTIEPIMDKLDLIVLTEINVNNEEARIYNIKGFKSTYKCRHNRNGGGIIIFYRDYITMVTNDVQFISAELLILKFTHEQHNYTLAAFYRPPSNNVNEFVEELENLLSSDLLRHERNLIMVGDINLCYINRVYGWDHYLNIIYTYGLINTIDGPTRQEIYGSTITSSCIDHINIRLDTNEYRSFILTHKIADHYCTGFVIKHKENNSKNRNIQNDGVDCNNLIEIISTKKVNLEIQRENWWPLLDIHDPEILYNKIVYKFEQIYEKSKIQIQEKRNYKHNQWINKEILDLIKQKENIWTRVKRNRNSLQLRNEFKRIRNQLTNEIRKAKRNYYYTLFAEISGDIRETWAQINEFINGKKKPTIVENIKKNFKIQNIEEIETLTETFNNNFHTITETIRSDLQGPKFNLNQMMNEQINNRENMNMYFYRMNADSLYYIIHKIKVKSSPGPDGIRPKDIKNNLFWLKLVLIHLINRIIDTGTIPTAMKTTNLRPIYKKGSRTDLNNYRPIGSVSVITKILEHHIDGQMKKYLLKFDILKKEQYGFIPGRSTIDLLERLTNNINIALNNNKFVVGVALDLTKAFDLIDYNIMLQKLQDIGISNKLYRLLKNYFTDRKVSVQIGNTVSGKMTQISGLIQGSVIAPTLFNIYVNDLTNLSLHSTVLQFADDTFLYTVHKTLNNAINYMQEDLNLVTKYFFNNSIKLNCNKTKQIIFKNPRIQNVRYTRLYAHSHACLGNAECSCEPLQNNNTIKHLGLYLDSDMKYGSHIAHVTDIIRIAIIKMYAIEDSIPLPTKRIIYFAIIQSIIIYGINIYYVAPQYLINRLKRILKRVIRVMFNGVPIDMLGIMSFESLAKYVDLMRNYFNDTYRNIEENDYNLRNRAYVPIRYNNF
jgi:molecular chaperone GrpE (heat shock protein)